MPSVGDPAPTFELQNHDAEPVSLSEYRGQRVVLYFYPEAATSGCTVEARSFRDAWDRFDAHDIPVLGVSLDPVEDIAGFRQAEDLPFTLLSDPDGTVAKAYDVYDSGIHDGDPYELATRTTFLIGPEGTIDAIYEDVTPDGHAEEILADLTAE